MGERIDETTTVNDVVKRVPASVAVFNEHGIDACCGGAAGVREAALRDGADPAALLAALRQVAGGDGASVKAGP